MGPETGEWAVDDQLAELGRVLAAAVRASGTTLTEVFGIGPAIAATAIGDVRDISQFPAGTTSPPTTASCRPGVLRQLGEGWRPSLVTGGPLPLRPPAATVRVRATMAAASSRTGTLDRWEAGQAKRPPAKGR